jgi:predicted ester cyclase
MRPDTVKRADPMAILSTYYACFNERRVADAAALFHRDAVLMQMPGAQQQRGPDGYASFAAGWLQGFPDARLTVDRVLPRDHGMYEVDLTATGTHTGPLSLGGWQFQPTGARARLQLRELLEIREGQVVSSSLSIDVQDLVHQLARVDVRALLQHLARIQRLAEQLGAANGDAVRQRELVDRLGIELDAARHLARPYFRGRKSQQAG